MIIAIQSPTTEKVREIETAITQQQLELWEEYQKAMGSNLLGATPLDFKPFPEINLALTPQQVAQMGPTNKDLALLGSLIASMPMAESEQKQLIEFPKQLSQLATNEEALHEFAQDARKYTTVTDLLNQLAIRLSQIETPATKYTETRSKAKITPSEEKLFHDVDSNLKELFFDAMNKLIPSVQDEVDSWLKQPGFATESARVNKVWPLVRHLARFSAEEQKLWASEYMYQFNTLWLHTSTQSLAVRLSGKPMSYQDNEVLWSLATSVAPEQEESLFMSLQQSVTTGSYAHRIRMLTRVEGWLSRLPTGEQAAFLKAFTQVMTQAKEGRDWDVFVNLVEKTARWWNKKDGAYQTQLSTLWLGLASQDLSALDSVLAHCLQQPKSDWIQQLTLTSSLPASITTQLPALYWQILAELANTKENKVDKEAATAWYFDSLRHKPKIKSIFNQWVANPERTLELVRTLNELTSYSLTVEQEAALLHLADECLLNQPTFSLCCQVLANTSKILAETTLLSKEDKINLSNEMLSVPPGKLVGLLKGLKDYPEALKANPQVFSTLLHYANNPDLDATRVEQLTTVLLEVAGTKSQAPNYLKHLSKGVERFQDPQFSEHDIDRLLILLRGDDALPAEQVLFDNIALYLENRVNKGQQQAAKSTIDLFYRLAKTYRGDVERMFNLEDNAELREMFDFEKQRKTMLNQRVIWMHLLNHNAFVTGTKVDKELDSHFFQWSHAQNQEMLQRGLDLYLAETAKLLEQKPKARLALDRDLSSNQQRSLLRLADEMAIIGKPQLSATSFVDAKKLKGDLAQLTANYQQGLFKSKSRLTQFKDLQESIELELQRERPHARIGRYEALLVIFQNARLVAMQNDLEDNKARWFKLNRSGHSRYFSTLNQMEDLIVRHWVHDVQAVQSFQNYTALCQKNMLQLTTELAEALDAHYEETKKQHNQPGAKAKLIRMFSNTDLPLLRNMKSELLRFKQDSKDNTFTAKSLDEVSAQLQKNLPKLPGHLQTLAKEVLMRSEALATHLQEHVAHPAKPILGSAPGEL